MCMKSICLPHSCSDFLKSDGDSGSDSDDDKRVIKSARDKRLSELSACCDEIRVGPTAAADRGYQRQISLTMTLPRTEQDENQRLELNPDSF